MTTEILIAIRVICFVVIFVSGVVHYVVFCGEIMPTLERLGYECHMGTITKYKGGFLATLYEYKMHCLENKLPLTGWRVYWTSMCMLVLAWACLMLSIDF